MSDVSKRNDILIIATAAFVAVAAIVTYTLVDPALSKWMPKCFFYQVTGWHCPGCGAQRALHAMLHGHITEAWDFNPFIFFIVPAAIVLGLVEAFRSRIPGVYRTVYRPSTFIIILFIIVSWTVLRNILHI